MPGLWPAQRVFEKVRRLPDLLSSVCIPGKTARSRKIKLVIRFADAGQAFPYDGGGEPKPARTIGIIGE